MTMVKGPFTLKCVIMQCYIRRKAQITLIVGTTIKCLASGKPRSIYAKDSHF